MRPPFAGRLNGGPASLEINKYSVSSLEGELCSAAGPAARFLKHALGKYTLRASLTSNSPFGFDDKLKDPYSEEPWGLFIRRELRWLNRLKRTPKSGQSSAHPSAAARGTLGLPLEFGGTQSHTGLLRCRYAIGQPLARRKKRLFPRSRKQSRIFKTCFQSLAGVSMGHTLRDGNSEGLNP